MSELAWWCWNWKLADDPWDAYELADRIELMDEWVELDGDAIRRAELPPTEGDPPPADPVVERSTGRPRDLLRTSIRSRASALRISRSAARRVADADLEW